MRRMTRWLAAITVTLAVGAVAAGCGASSGVHASAGGIDHIQITVSHYPTTLHSLPFMIGMDKGFFRDQKIDITRVFGSSGGGTTTRNVLAGHTQFGVVALPSVLQAIHAGAPLVMLGGGSDNLDELHWVTRKGAPFSDAKDLVGHTWGYTEPASVTDAASRLILEKAGIDPKRVDLKATGGVSEGLTLLKTGGVDATPLDDPSFSAQKSRWKEVFGVAEYIKKLQQDAVVTNPQLTKSNPGLVRRFLAAVNQSNQWLYAHPREAAAIFARHAEIDPAAARSAVQAQVDSRRWNLALSPEGVRNMIHGAQLAGALPKDVKIPWSQILNQSFLPAGVPKVDAKTLPDYVANQQ